MQFDSFIFPLFFALVLALYWTMRSSIRAQNALIVVSSYVFYGWWDPRFLLLLALSTVIDFFVAQRIESARDAGNPALARRALQVSLVANLGILAVFKYFNFFIASAVDALAAIGVEAHLPTLRIVLPVGISFYTFQTLSYSIDVYRGVLPASRSVLAFAGYVAFFPQLVAGPIERATRLLPQFDLPRTLDVPRLRSALLLIVYGMVKKVAIADNMAPLSDYVFGLPSDELSGALVAAGALAFAVQIYADFSAYSDIARGTARLMGFELCVNFNQPYLSLTPSDFWRRWHISLSQWLRDYLYVPLGGNRGTVSKTYRNLMATMVLGGLWHGASWNFAAWGVFHGVILCVYRALRVDDAVERASRPARAAAGAVFFAFTLYGWLLFRAGSLEQVVELTRALVGTWAGTPLAWSIVANVAFFAWPIAVHHALSRNLDGEKWAPASAWGQRLLLAAVIIYGVTHARASETAFIYFQF